MTQEPVAWMSPDESSVALTKLHESWVPLYTMGGQQISMTREDIIRMARDTCVQEPREDLESTAWVFGIEGLERFAALVAAAERNRTWTQAHWTEYERSIAAAEREACVKACEDEILRVKPVYSVTAENCVKAIKARNKT